ncbi:MAG: DUF2071 domain-containing protein [Lentisphaeria bacterium]|nr:DUF2071 domain-containing protein [Lentisphaeria bacterium]
MQSKPVFLEADWSWLIMLNYEIDPEKLLPLVPFGTELDFYNGTCYISIVGFWFSNTRVKKIGFPFHRNFEELNLRFYVRRKSAGGWRRGVVFVKELVPKFAIAFIARTLYNENYISLPMAHEHIFENKIPQKISYSWKLNNHWNHLSVSPEVEERSFISNSEQEFITEHYWGYSAKNENSSIEYEVQHPAWTYR